MEFAGVNEQFELGFNAVDGQPVDFQQPAANASARVAFSAADRQGIANNKNARAADHNRRPKGSIEIIGCI